MAISIYFYNFADGSYQVRKLLSIEHILVIRKINLVYGSYFRKHSTMAMS